MSEEQAFLEEHGLSVGKKVGDYDVLGVLGAGGMGIVLRAGRREPDGSVREVALKVMSAAAARDATLRKRFVREAKATEATNHPNVIRILDTFEHEGLPIIVMELLSGTTLSARIATLGKLPLEEALFIFARIVSAVGTAHSIGLVHRDLKPDNVFVLPEEPFVKVLDFGIAKARAGSGLEGTAALTKTGMAMGTPFYMSPEQTFGERNLDHRADIWSLGIMLFEAVSGKLLTRGATLHEVLSHVLKANFPRLDAVEPEVPEPIATLCARMLSKDPEGRPADLREVHEVLTRHSGSSDSPRSFGAAREVEAEPVMSVPALGGTVVMSESDASASPSTPLRLAQVVIPTPRDRPADPPARSTIESDEEATLFSTPKPHLKAKPAPGSLWIWVALASAVALAVVAWLATR